MSIEPEDLLYRRLHQGAYKGEQVKYPAFMTNGEYDEEISVYLAKLLDSPHGCLQGKQGFRVGVISVAEVQTLGFTVVHDPQPGDPAHALVMGPNNKQIASALADVMKIVPG